ncbi:MAG: universal stress protein [Planctomycetota bacterium]|nr:MAG: universal stress protein [Planctomycetota bacterium]REJ89470.1 MAG: universal stress protein [Planctomycetota bacterium]REK28959.1 MAG: universal stress protein [Planctomycetota bacterium]REK39607.1 MAG: universal stress protein [Planctomycetota bacterium]
MIQLRHILHPTDFSEPARQAMAYALELAQRFDAELHALYVVPPMAAMPWSSSGYVPPSMVEAEERHRLEAADKLHSLMPSNEGGNPTVQHVVRDGTPFVRIIEYAREAGIDLIVIGTHGHTGLKQMLLGSVAERVVRKASCPVLTVRPEGHQFVMP